MCAPSPRAASPLRTWIRLLPTWRASLTCGVVSTGATVVVPCRRLPATPRVLTLGAVGSPPHQKRKASMRLGSFLAWGRLGRYRLAGITGARVAATPVAPSRPARMWRWVVAAVMANLAAVRHLLTIPSTRIMRMCRRSFSPRSRCRAWAAWVILILATPTLLMLLPVLWKPPTRRAISSSRSGRRVSLTRIRM